MKRSDDWRMEKLKKTSEQGYQSNYQRRKGEVTGRRYQLRRLGGAMIAERKGRGGRGHPGVSGE